MDSGSTCTSSVRFWKGCEDESKVREGIVRQNSGAVLPRGSTHFWCESKANFFTENGKKD